MAIAEPEAKELKYMCIESGREGRERELMDIIKNMEADGEFEGYGLRGLAVGKEIYEEAMRISYKYNVPAAYVMRKAIWRRLYGML